MVRATSQEQTAALEEERKDKRARYYEYEFRRMEQTISSNAEGAGNI